MIWFEFCKFGIVIFGLMSLLFITITKCLSISKVKLNWICHSKWSEYIESFPYEIMYKKGKENAMRMLILSQMHGIYYIKLNVVGFDHIKGL